MSIYTYVDPRQREEIRARQGEDVWVLVNHVRAEKRESFEYLLHEIVLPVLSHVHPETYNAIRILTPALPNTDGSLTYIFLMDPVIPEGIYSVSAILHKYYPAEQAEQYLKAWNEALAEPQMEYDMVQSAW